MELGRLLDSTGLPAVFVGFEPIPAPPDRPARRPDRATPRPGRASRARSRCRPRRAATSRSGRGSPSGANYVVTNAHVVAGADRRAIRVATADDRLLDGTAVLVRPGVRHRGHPRPGARGARPAVRRGRPRRGARSARRSGIRAAVAWRCCRPWSAARTPATGRDIYSEKTVRRQILELRAAIDRGDSGGPLILQDGTVGGVVFAEARTDPDVGYALSPTEVATRVAPAIGRTEAVDTGACVR